MSEITTADLRRIVDNSDECGEVPIIVANGQLVVFQWRDRLFIYSRRANKAYEIKPDFEFGLTVNQLL